MEINRIGCVSVEKKQSRTQKNGAGDTAPGKDTDCVSRSFCPKLAISEDPVCGSAHCQIAPYWAAELGKTEIIAYQASKRGGTIHDELTRNGRITTGGEAVLVAKSEVLAL